MNFQAGVKTWLVATAAFVDKGGDSRNADKHSQLESLSLVFLKSQKTLSKTHGLQMSYQRIICAPRRAFFLPFAWRNSTTWLWKLVYGESVVIFWPWAKSDDKIALQFRTARRRRKKILWADVDSEIRERFTFDTSGRCLELYDPFPNPNVPVVSKSAFFVPSARNISYYHTFWLKFVLISSYEFSQMRYCNKGNTEIV